MIVLLNLCVWIISVHPIPLIDENTEAIFKMDVSWENVLLVLFDIVINTMRVMVHIQIQWRPNINPIYKSV